MATYPVINKQTGEQKENRHHGVPEERAEKTLNFFEDEGSHESKAKDSLYVGSTTSYDHTSGGAPNKALVAGHTTPKSSDFR